MAKFTVIDGIVEGSPEEIVEIVLGLTDTEADEETREVDTASKTLYVTGCGEHGRMTIHTGLDLDRQTALIDLIVDTVRGVIKIDSYEQYSFVVRYGQVFDTADILDDIVDALAHILRVDREEIDLRNEV